MAKQYVYPRVHTTSMHDDDDDDDGCVGGSSVSVWLVRARAYMPRGGRTARATDSTSTDSRSASTEEADARVVGVTRGRIRESRARCHAARDAYYVAACARTEPANASGSGAAAAAAAAACVTLRAAYDAACPRSWVEHFDAKRAEDAKVRRVLASREGGA